MKVKRQMFTGQKMNSPMDSLPSPSGSIPRQASSSGLSESGTGPILDYSLNLDSSGGSQSLTMTPTPTYTGDLNWPRKVSYGNGYSSGGDYDDSEDAEGPTLQQGIWGVLGCAGVYKGVRRCTGVYWGVLGCTGVYRGILGCIGVYWGVQGYTGVYRGVQRCTGVY